MSTEQNKAVVRRFFELYDQGKLDQLEQEVVDPAAVIHLTGVPKPLTRGEFKQTGVAFHLAFPDHTATIQDQVAEDDMVVTRSTFRGTQRGELQGIPATGKSVTFDQVNIHRITGGRIVEAWAYFDQFSLLQQLGVIPMPAGA
jgi:steroid delta-isomerase-like uncharacterized protein